MILINEIRLKITEDESVLKKAIEKKLGQKVYAFEIRKKSLDARKQPCYVYSVAVETMNEEKLLEKGYQKYRKENLDPLWQERKETCLIIGYGPAGIFSAWHLLAAGFKVHVFEKGKRIPEREKDVRRFFEEGVLNENSNVQFGEGGAGTFSDAKLTTRIKDPYIGYILDVFIRNGADPAIGYEQHPHIGTDAIRRIIVRITDSLMERGCIFHFEEAMKELILDENHHVTGIRTDKGEYEADAVLLGTGHSSYDTVRMLKNKGIFMEKKDISIGFRVEHPQSMIDARQTDGLIKEANEYFLRYKDRKGVYSFCMCPGGMVIPAMSEKETIVTNGMSYADRSSGIANSAILIQVPKEEFDDGYAYLHRIEKEAYAYSASYRALSQNIRDFMEEKTGELIFPSTYPLGTEIYDFNRFFAKEDREIIRNAFRLFDRQIPGFIDQGIMVGPETRSSCPIRIRRNETMESMNTPSLYPMGEGAGYGGGIMSCALDGIRIANAIIWKYGTLSENG